MFKSMHSCQQIKASLLGIFVLIFLYIIPAGAVDNSLPITREKAVTIANTEMVKLGYDLTELDMKVDEDNKEWNEWWESRRRGYLGPAVKADFEEKDKKLRGRTFWRISYRLRPKNDHERLGGGSVFVDAKTGEVILVIPAH